MRDTALVTRGTAAAILLVAAFVAIAMAFALSLGGAGCAAGTREPLTTTSTASQTGAAGGAAASRTSDSQTGPPQTLAPVAGWTITLIPGTSRMRTEYEQPGEPASTTGTWSPPAPPEFQPSVAIDGDHVVYSAFYSGRPQVYLYDIATGSVTQLTDDPDDRVKAYGEQIEVQISGDLVAWQKGYSDEAIYVRDLATGQTKRVQPQQTLVSWRLTGGRLAWTEGTSVHGSQLNLYDPAAGSTKTITAAYGLTGFGMDDRHLAWVGGAYWNEMYLYDLTTGQTSKVAVASQQTGDFLVVKGDVLAWAESYAGGALTRIVLCDPATGHTKVLDQGGPFAPGFQSDGRYLAWMRGEDDTGSEVRVYDTQTGTVVKLGDPTAGQDSWPSIDAGRVTWNRSFPPGMEEAIMVRDLPDGPAIRLTDSIFFDQPPALSGNHVVWSRRNSFAGATQGRGIFVATRPGS